MSATISAAPTTDSRDDPARVLADRLASGGDDRIDRSGITGDAGYGTPSLPVSGDVRFSTATVEAGPRGWRAVEEIEATLGQGGRWSDAGIGALCGSIRSRLQSRLGIDGSRTILAASGTDAELLMLAVIERGISGPVTNIVMTPKETGSGVMAACDGRHFRDQTCLGTAVRKDARIAGWEDADIETVAFDMRLPGGTARSAGDMDSELTALAREALARDRTVLLHVLDTSKTGLQISTRGTAERLMRYAPGRVHVVVDACQNRGDAALLRADLERGFAVILTGSEFAGGPPLSGALLLPPALVERMQTAHPLPVGLNDYTTAHDWPKTLREILCAGMKRHNGGAPLRWVAALAELDAFDRIDGDLVASITGRFEEEIHGRASALPFVKPLFGLDDSTPRTRSIVPLLALRSDGSFLSMAQTEDLHRALRSPLGEPSDAVLQRIVTIGDPVGIGERAALPVCLDAPRIADIGERIGEGHSIETAFEETLADLDALFAKWAALVEGKV